MKFSVLCPLIDLHLAETAGLRLPTKSYTEKATTLKSTAASDLGRLQRNPTAYLLWIRQASTR